MIKKYRVFNKLTSRYLGTLDNGVPGVRFRKSRQKVHNQSG